MSEGVFPREVVSKVFERAAEAARMGHQIDVSEIAETFKGAEHRSKKPKLLLIGGVNGAGKSTLAEGLGPLDELTILNPDSRTEFFLGQDPQRNLASANLKAAQEAEQGLRTSIEKGSDIGIETVLSSPKYIEVVQRAISLGYIVQFIYIGLVDRETSARRVAERVRRGGHDVPREKIWSRWDKSWDNMIIFRNLAQVAYIYANLDGEWEQSPARLVAWKEEGQMEKVASKVLPELDLRWP